MGEEFSIEQVEELLRRLTPSTVVGPTVPLGNRNLYHAAPSLARQLVRVMKENDELRATILRLTQEPYDDDERLLIED